MKRSHTESLTSPGRGTILAPGTPMTAGPRLRGWEEALGRGFHLAERTLCRVARRRGLSILIVGLTSFSIGAALTLYARAPLPFVHDEFSNLLAADTFAHGRLTNPTHPLWVHFETFYVIQQPTYASKYPPGLGLMLAVGQVIFGDPIVGAWLSSALACAATCWMLMAWFRPRWALLGGLLTALHPLVLTWSQCYMGGSVAMLGGALVLGALRRIAGRARPRVRDATLMGLGMTLLANTRPFEGMVLSLLASAVLLRGMFGPDRPPLLVAIGHVGLPLAGVLVVGAAAMIAYNLRVTGHPLRIPYMVYETTYSRTPLFFWQPVRPEPAYRHAIMRDHHSGWEYHFYEENDSFAHILDIDYRKLRCWFSAYFPGTVRGEAILVLFLSPWILRNDRWPRRALGMCGLFFAAMLLETARPQAHYVAPAFGLMMVPVLQAMRRLCVWTWEGRPTGRLLLRILVVSCLALPWNTHVRLAGAFDGQESIVQMSHRVRLLGQLKGMPGRHLVIVRYAPGHSPHAEWVYNEADIDGAKVIWAREMEDSQNRKLLDYFKDRHLWLVEPDAEVPRLVPYPVGPLASGTQAR